MVTEEKKEGKRLQVGWENRRNSSDLISFIYLHDHESGDGESERKRTQIQSNLIQFNI